MSTRAAFDGEAPRFTSSTASGPETTVLAADRLHEAAGQTRASCSEIQTASIRAPPASAAGPATSGSEEYATNATETEDSADRSASSGATSVARTTASKEAF